MGNLNCVQQCQEHVETQKRIAELQEGSEFARKKHVMGFASGTEQVLLWLNDDTSTLKWKCKDGDTSEVTDIRLEEIDKIKSQGDTEWSMVTAKGELLIDLQASSTEERDAWVRDVRLLSDGQQPVGESEAAEEKAVSGWSLRGKVEERNRHQTYWSQRAQELEDRQKEAEERKKQLSGVGMKYTAIAMSKRDSEST